MVGRSGALGQIGRIYEVVTDSHANYRVVWTVCKPCLPETAATKPSAAIAAAVTMVRGSSCSRPNRFWVGHKAVADLADGGDGLGVGCSL